MLRLPVLFILLFFLFHLAPLPGYDKKTTPPTYVGSKKCGECHENDRIGNQYKIWTKSPHSKAYLSLKGKKGQELAVSLNIDSPEKSLQCLKCHTTGQGKSETVINEGVGCEACHGAGSDYYKASIHVDFSSRENGYRRAVANGMYPVLGITGLKAREKLCLSCHSKERPCIVISQNDNYNDRIPLQVIDSLWKGDVNFRHPLRR